MTTTGPDHQTLLAAVELANRAPSVHNTQPWRWLVGNSSIHLMADRTRHVPEGRDLLISCGAALHHLRTAFAALGWATVVHRVPNDHDPDHLAAIEPRPHVPADNDVALAAAINRRRTDWRRFRSCEIPSDHLDLLVRRAARAGALLVPVMDGAVRWLLTRALGSARELPSRSRTARGGGLATAARHEEDSGQLLVVATVRDDPVSFLRAGEAASAVVLTATDLGLATCLLSPPWSDVRDVVRDQVLDGAASPQVIVRAGWAPASASPLPRSPVRRAEDTVDYLPGVRHQ